MFKARFKFAFRLVCAVALMSISANAQETRIPAATLFDEFGDEPYGSSSARLANVGTTLANDPRLRAYIIVYRGQNDPPGKSYRYAQRVKTFLNAQANHFGFAADNVIVIDGGRREKLSQEVWLVPVGVAAPAISPTITDELVLGLEPVLFDEYPMRSERDEDFDSWDGRYEEAPGRLDGFATALKRFPNSRGYIVARSLAVYLLRPIGPRMKTGTRLYRHIRSEKLSDPPGADIRMGQDEKRYLTTNGGVEASRLVVIGCGWGKPPRPGPEELSKDHVYERMYVTRNLELWLVPNSSASQPDAWTTCKEFK